MTPLAVERVLQARRRRGGLVAVFDLDGTLAPIARRPEHARVPDATCRALALLARRFDTAVGVVSGRPLREVRKMIPTRGIWLAGIHGCERRSPRGPVERIWSAPTQRTGVRLAARLGTAIRHSEGAWVERKGPMVAIHLREATAAERRLIDSRAEELCPPGYSVIRGRHVIEYRPTASSTKGDAVRWIASSQPRAPVLYLGDDTTDEDAFRALGRADFTVLVGGRAARAERGGKTPPGTHARYRLPGPASVTRVIDRLAKEDSEAAGLRPGHRHPSPVASTRK